MKTKLRFYEGCDYRAPLYVFGNEFGPVLLTKEAALDDAYDEWIEVNTACHLTDDEQRELGEAEYEAMLDSGELRINGGGTVAHADHYEWFREFDSAREAAAFLRSFRRR